MAIYFPLWKDKEINIGTGDRIDFHIIFGNEIIYSGTGVKRPGGVGINVRVNDLVIKAFSDMGFPVVGGSTGWRDYFGNGVPPVFTIRTDKGSIIFNPVWDWSYNYDEPLSSSPRRILTRPLRKDGIIEVDSRQVVTFSQWTDSSRSISATYGGRSFSLGSHKTGVAYLDLRPLSHGDELSISSYSTQKYRVIHSCADFVLHYMNDVGGWDSILMNGNCIPSQDYNRKKIVTSDLNDEPLSIGERTYFVGITQCWELRRANMINGEGMNVHQVFGSTHCVLESLNEDGENRFIPVQIDTNRCEEKSYKTNGRQMVEISIIVKTSQGRMRR